MALDDRERFEAYLYPRRHALLQTLLPTPDVRIDRQAQQLEFLHAFIRIANGPCVKRLRQPPARTGPDIVVSPIPDFKRALLERTRKRRTLADDANRIQFATILQCTNEGVFLC